MIFPLSSLTAILLATTAAALPFDEVPPQSVSAAWYSGYQSKHLPANQIPFEKYTHVTYAFLATTEHIDTLTVVETDEQKLIDFAKECRAHKNVKCLISLGGWTGSRFFSRHISTAEKRTAFADTIMNVIKKYDVHGVDFDWEHPGSPGIGCNEFSPADTTNFLLLLKELRSRPAGKDLFLTAATVEGVYTGPKGEPIIGEFAKLIDYFAIMNYDIFGSWGGAVGPNAPLDSSCAGFPSRSATSAVAAWKKAGVPGNKLVLGVPAYGHSFHVFKADAFEADQKTLKASPPVDHKNPSIGNKGEPGGNNVCGVFEPPSDYFDFYALIDAGFLTKDGKPAEGMSYRFDQCSKTPFVYNPQSEIMVSYDDQESSAAKGKFVKDNGLLGFALYNANGDYGTMIVDALRKGMGV